MNAVRIAPWCLLMVLAACGDGPATSPGEDAAVAPGAPDAATSRAPDAASSSEPGGPQVLLLETSPAAIGPGDAVTFAALVSDPDGTSDIVGGSLRDPGGVHYGVFASTGPGSFALHSDGPAIDAARPLVGEAGTVDRVFVAEFVDAAGHRGSREVTLRIGCDSGAVCGPTCVDLDTDVHHCGACGAALPTGADLACIDGAPGCQGPQETLCGDQHCAALDWELADCGACGRHCGQIAPYQPDGCIEGSCTYEFKTLDPDHATCGAYCEARGLACDATLPAWDGWAQYDNGTLWRLQDCDEIAPGTLDGSPVAGIWDCTCSL